MASSLPSQDFEPPFLEFFGMTRAPFGSLSAPSEFFHSDQCSLLNFHLTAATERVDSLIVVCGADGIGKTTLLNQYIAGLGDELCYVAFDETCVQGTEFYCSFLKQIGFGEISGTLRELQHITREFIIHRGNKGKHVLFFMDNAHLVRPAVLEQLRWTADIKIDNERALSLVLAGNLNLQRIMDSPAMRSLQFRYQTNFHIRAYSEVETDDYIRNRLNLAGAADAAKFSDESRALIYRFTGGNPRMINTLCNAVLTESCALGTRVISEQRIRSVADARKMLPHVVPIRGKGRRKNDPHVSLSMHDTNAGERITCRQPDTTLSISETLQAPLRHDVEIKELLVEIAELSSQLEEANKAKHLALTNAGKHDKDLGEVRAQLAAQIESTENLAKAIDDKAKDIGQLKAALSDSEQLRREVEKAGQSLADEIDELHGKLDASNKEVEKPTAKQKQYDEEIDQLTEALADSKVTLAERDKAVEKLAASFNQWETSKSDEVITDLRAQLAPQAIELVGPLTTDASSAVEIANLKKALSASKKALLQSEQSTKDLIADLRKKQRLTKRASTTHAKTQVQFEFLERRNAELQTSVEELNADLKVSAKKAGQIDAPEKPLENYREEHVTLRNQRETLENLEKLVAEKDGRIAELQAGLDSYTAQTSRTETLLPEKMAILHSSEREFVSSNGNATTVEILLDGKLLKVVDLAGGPSRIMIGRARDCDLLLNSKFVSGHHAFIVCTEDRIAIEDLHSSNGIFVNSKKVGHSDLRPGDIVAIGNFRLRLKRG